MGICQTRPSDCLMQSVPTKMFQRFLVTAAPHGGPRNQSSAKTSRGYVQSRHRFRLLLNAFNWRTRTSEKSTAISHPSFSAAEEAIQASSRQRTGNCLASEWTGSTEFAGSAEAKKIRAGDIAMGAAPRIDFESRPRQRRFWRSHTAHNSNKYLDIHPRFLLQIDAKFGSPKQENRLEKNVGFLRRQNKLRKHFRASSNFFD